MKKILILLIYIMLVFTLVACGGNGVKDDDVSIIDNSNDTYSSTEDSEEENTEEQNPHEQAASTNKSNNSSKAIYESFEEFNDASTSLGKHILEVSNDNEFVLENQGIFNSYDIAPFNYIYPLFGIGKSVETAGKFDVEMETTVLQIAWYKDASISYDNANSYQLSGTDKKGDKIKIDIMYDSKVDSLRLEGYKNDVLESIFEYIKTPNGYAAQHYCEEITRSEGYNPVFEFCTFRTIFEGTNGTFARFDGVDSEPDSIYCNVPDDDTFIDGASHWLNITDGEFKGNIRGTEF